MTQFGPICHDIGSTKFSQKQKWQLDHFRAPLGQWHPNFGDKNLQQIVMLSTLEYSWSTFIQKIKRA